MPAGTALTEEERLSILTLREAGLSARDISAAVKRSVGVCQKVIKDGKASRKPNNRGGKSKLTERDYRRIVRAACGGSVGAKAIKDRLQLDCCVRTVQRVLSDVDWLAYKKRPAAPLIQPRHQKARVKFAADHALWEDIDWAFVVFSDEKKWNIDGSDGMRYQWVDSRRPMEINIRRHTGGGSVMVWGGFAGGRMTELKFLSGKVDSHQYLVTLQSHLQPFIDPETQIFQQDNAPIHTSKATKDWLSTEKIDVLTWPAYSPDLNPMENVWGTMTQRVYAMGKQYQSESELKCAVQQAWQEISSQQLTNLIKSMRHRCIKVLKEQGAYILY